MTRDIKFLKRTLYVSVDSRIIFHYNRTKVNVNQRGLYAKKNKGHSFKGNTQHPRGSLAAESNHPDHQKLYLFRQIESAQDPRRTSPHKEN